MSVPGHDQRDWEFARAYELPIHKVIGPADDGQVCDMDAGAFVAPGVLVNSGKYSGLTSAEAFDAMTDSMS